MNKSTQPAAWREILSNSPDDDEAVEEIQRLQDKIAQVERLGRFKKDIFKRKNDIAPIFMAVGTRLKQLEKQELDFEAEMLLDVIEEFLSGKSSAKDFIKFWNEGISAPVK